MSDQKPAYDPELLQALKDSLRQQAPVTPQELAKQEERDVRAWVLATYGAPGFEGTVGPSDLQRTFRSLSFNRACSILEAMEEDGDLERWPRVALHWIVAPAAKPTRAGVEFHLSPKEHGALLRLLDERLEFVAGIKATNPEDERLAQGLEAILRADLPALRAIRARLKRPASAIRAGTPRAVWHCKECGRGQVGGKHVFPGERMIDDGRAVPTVLTIQRCRYCKAER